MNALKNHLRRQARRRRYSTVARTIQIKLEQAQKDIADALFGPLIVRYDISKLFGNMRVIGHGSFGDIFCADVLKSNGLFYIGNKVAIKKISLEQPLRDLKKRGMYLK